MDLRQLRYFAQIIKRGRSELSRVSWTFSRGRCTNYDTVIGLQARQDKGFTK